MLIVTKIEAAHRQLCTAIRMFFDDDDAVAVHTLACAAREIYEKHCTKADIDKTFDAVKWANQDYTNKQLWDILNYARNFFKHPGTSLDDEIEFDDSVNDFTLFSVCHDCAVLCGASQPIEAQAFGLWFLGTNETYKEGTDPADVAIADKFAQLVDDNYPELKLAKTRSEKKAIGKRMLAEIYMDTR